MSNLLEFICPSRYLAVSAGKRKRGRERTVEWCGSHHLSHSKRHGSSTSHFHSLRMHRSSQASAEDSMDYDYSDDANMYVSSQFSLMMGQLVHEHLDPLLLTSLMDK